MNPAPELSIIIPTRNCLRWLPRAIASIGDGANLEIIVIDDGSTDGTGEFLKTAAADRSWISVRTISARW